MNREEPDGGDLSSDIQYLAGVGPNRAARLRKLGIQTAGDLLEYFPFRHEQHHSRVIENLEEGMIATVVGEIAAVRTRGFGGRGPSVSADLIDNTGRCSLTWFNAGWMKDRIRRGSVVRATGRVTEYRQLAQLLNPKIELLGRDAAPIDESEPSRFIGVYPASSGMSSQAIAKLIDRHLDHLLQRVQEWYPEEYRRQRNLSGRRWSLGIMHRPTDSSEVEKARRRLAYDELFLLQLATTLARSHRRGLSTALALSCTPAIDRRIRSRFPFHLTKAQDRAAREISADLAQNRPMNRMLQGDVGCGKTVVALHAALIAVANRMQVALMAPTELLAEQHAKSIQCYLDGSRVRHALLVGGRMTSARRALLAAIESGETDIVVGTHALIQREVHFGRLGLVVVDEQHRFGVRQRATIRSKGPAPHYLVMTATPIPRTLAMTVFGDLDVSTIDELPPGRSDIHTRIVAPKEQGPAWNCVRERLQAGEQAYVVYPIIDESDKMEVRAATTEFERLRDTVFAQHSVGLLHGRMKSAEREAAMSGFVAGEVDVLVATTVIEVGIDVPNATCIVIEHAERYGLSQLHQLRGRIGRGDRQGYCFLMTTSRQVEANQRLVVLARSTDGFKIAEEDLRIRGPGETLGTRQHGLPDLKVADLLRDGELIRMAQRDAGDIIRTDPHLRGETASILRQRLLARYGHTLEFLDVG